MEKECYENPRLVALYDLLNRSGADWAYYLDLVAEAAGPILDVGCGTGALTVEAAQRGHAVYGLDPSAAMLDVARRRLSERPLRPDRLLGALTEANRQLNRSRAGGQRVFESLILRLTAS